MKVLQINNHHKYCGGAEKYYLDISKLLTKEGINVANFSMKDRDNEKTKWSKYFVSNISSSKNDIINRIKISTRSFYSREAILKINKILDDFRPDIVHIHNIHYYISPLILFEIKKRNIPIVMTVHDYQVISPNVNLFSNGKIDESTKYYRFYNAILHKSVKSSYGASFVAAMSSYFHCLVKTYTKNVDTFIAPSKFMKNKLLEYGIEKSKIKYLPNFIGIEKFKQTTLKSNNKYVLYFGRLAEHKGILNLIYIAKRVPNVHFKIVGEVSDTKVKKAIYEAKNSGFVKNIEFMDHQNQKRLGKIIDGCEFTIVPSIWSENQPYSILQSYIHGKPVIASRVGGIPEIVLEGKTGYLCNPNDITSFTNKVRTLDKDTLKIMKKNIKLYIRNYSPQIHYQKLMNIYSSTIAKYKNGTLT